MNQGLVKFPPNQVNTFEPALDEETALEAEGVSPHLFRTQEQRQHSNYQTAPLKALYYQTLLVNLSGIRKSGCVYWKFV